uniref:Sulfhydryl oxidase n=1 Tax=Pithovirus LCPAC104 TaxID=2506589 RepID=A0A481Z483_9VIRU|nr:MAG: Erv1/Alr family disulfide (thiol) oxidoreductase [Pithovirus LCPAC104]
MNSFPKNPEYFGPGIWFVIHIIALKADNNSEDDKKNFMTLIKHIIYNIPCDICKKNAIQYYNRNYMLNTSSLFEWSVIFHNYVNYKLGKRKFSYNEAKILYENQNRCISCNNETNETNETLTRINYSPMY